MAYASGTVTGRDDLWDKLLSFLTTNPALVAANQAWEIVWSHDETNMSRRTLKGKGLSGLDEIYVSLEKQDGPHFAGEPILWVGGSTGVSPTAQVIIDHPGSLTRYPAMFLDIAPMSYWFVANGRRFVVVVRISTVYNMIYGGLFLPYATPTTYTYPLFVGGCRGFSQGGSIAEVRTWRAPESLQYSGFIRPYADSGTSSYWFDPSAALLDPMGEWRGVASGAAKPQYGLNAWMSPNKQQESLQGVAINMPTWPGSTSSAMYQGVGYRSVMERTIEGFSGEVPITPLTLFSSGISGNPENPTIYGILDGCYQAGGLSLTAESTFDVEGVEHIIFQNIMRTDVSSYWALALE